MTTFIYQLEKKEGSVLDYIYYFILSVLHKVIYIEVQFIMDGALLKIGLAHFLPLSLELSQ
jgi:hypothetical protein